MLGDMGMLLGIEDQEYFAKYPSFAKTSAKRKQVHEHFGILPSGPLITESEWKDLKYYYLETAPTSPLPPEDKPSMNWELDRFSIEPPRNRLPRMFATLTRIDERNNKLYIGDSSRNILSIFDETGQRIGNPLSFQNKITPVDIAFDSDLAYLASIGDVSGANPTAETAFITRIEGLHGNQNSLEESVVVSQLPRIADIELADLYGDNTPELIVSCFGTAAGKVTSFRLGQDGSLEERVLLAMPGAVKTQTHDFNGDGRLDVGVLLGNAREGFHILENLGNGEFRDHIVFQTHPSMGHTYFELTDFNGDNAADLLVVNGDNVDSDPYNTLKNFHGIRVYLNKGDFAFEQAYFYPMQGAFIAKAADFDSDGDMDIAAIAFYPDFDAASPENFVYLEAKGILDFVPHSSEKLNTGRWMTMDAGDLDGDGDIDLALGGAYLPIGMSHYMEKFEQLSNSGPVFLILRNNTLTDN